MWEGLWDFDVYDTGPTKNIEQKQDNTQLSKTETLLISMYLKQTLDNTKDKVDSIIKWFSWKEQELLQYLNTLKNTLPTDDNMLDDFMQIWELEASVKNKISDLKDDIEQQKEIPFEILWGQILVQNINWEWWLKFKKWKKEWKEISWNDIINFNSQTNRFEISIDHKWFPKHIELEYNGGNIIKVHDTRYNRVDRVNIRSRDLSVQDVSRYGYNKMRIESYQTPREIDIPFRWQRIKLQVLFKKEK
jgi:hypothetical protein